jgi:phosphatidylinositol phospholipase C delta
MSELISGIAKLSPFSKSKKPAVDDEDKGEAIDAGTVAGGGHASRQSAITKNQLRVSNALKSFLVKQDVLAETEVGLDQEQPTSALKELLDKPHINVPPEVYVTLGGTLHCEFETERALV